jgi:hypothetical protein
VTTTFLIQEHLRNNGTYPRGFVTIPNAVDHLTRARNESGAYVLAYAPTVEGKDYALWSRYVGENLGWLGETPIEQEPSDELIHSHKEIERQIWSVVDLSDSLVCFESETKRNSKSEVHIEDPEDGPASPVWSISTTAKQKNYTRINFDMTSTKVFAEMTKIVAAFRTPTVHDICNLTSVSCT